MCKLLTLPPELVVSWAISKSPFSSNLMPVTEFLSDFADKPKKTIIGKKKSTLLYDLINRFISYILHLRLYVIFIRCNSIRTKNLLLYWFYDANCALRKLKERKTFL